MKNLKSWPAFEIHQLSSSFKQQVLKFFKNLRWRSLLYQLNALSSLLRQEPFKLFQTK
jgi:hypothetical protein